MAKIIGILELGNYGEENFTTWHVVGVGPTDHATLCGMDGADENPMVGQLGPVAAPKGQKITCRECFIIWSGVVGLKLKRSNFITGSPNKSAEKQ